MFFVVRIGDIRDNGIGVWVLLLVGGKIVVYLLFVWWVVVWKSDWMFGGI